MNLFKKIIGYKNKIINKMKIKKALIRSQILENKIFNLMKIVYLIENCSGVISDSGGMQEEVLSANKNILVCRDTTERPETIESGLGKLVGTEINKNIEFLNKKSSNVENPYGKEVSTKIVDILQDIGV